MACLTMSTTGSTQAQHNVNSTETRNGNQSQCPHHIEATLGDRVSLAIQTLCRLFDGRTSLCHFVEQLICMSATTTLWRLRTPFSPIKTPNFPWSNPHQSLALIHGELPRKTARSLQFVVIEHEWWFSTLEINTPLCEHDKFSCPLLPRTEPKPTPSTRPTKCRAHASFLRVTKLHSPALQTEPKSMLTRFSTNCRASFEHTTSSPSPLAPLQLSPVRRYEVLDEILSMRRDFHRLLAPPNMTPSAFKIVRRNAKLGQWLCWSNQMPITCLTGCRKGFRRWSPNTSHNWPPTSDQLRHFALEHL